MLKGFCVSTKVLCVLYFGRKIAPASAGLSMRLRRKNRVVWLHYLFIEWFRYPSCARMLFQARGEDGEFRS